MLLFMVKKIFFLLTKQNLFQNLIYAKMKVIIKK